MISAATAAQTATMYSAATAACTSRRTFLAAAGLCAGCAAVAAARPSRASAGILSALFGRDDGDAGRAGQPGAANGSGVGVQEPATQAPPAFGSADYAACLPDWSGLGADEVAAIAISALLGRDFDTLLSLCAVEEFLDSQIQQLCVVRQLLDGPVSEWGPAWREQADIRPRDATRMLMATRLRAAYAADFLRFFATVAVDVDGADVRTMEIDSEKRSDNIGRQLVALDEALRAFDGLDLQVMDAWACDSLEEAVELGWLGASWDMFATGREAAAAIDSEMGYDLRTYCFSAGIGGAEQLKFVLPLCRYGDTWRIQRPLPYESPEKIFWYAGEGAEPVCDDARAVDGLPGVGDVAPAAYGPASPVAAPPFSDGHEATIAVLDTLWPRGDLGHSGDAAALAAAETMSAATSSAGGAGEFAFMRLFCADEFLSSADLTSMYPDTVTLQRFMHSYLGFGSIGTFFSGSAEFVPVAAPGYRTLSGWTLACEHGAVPLLRTASTFARWAIDANGENTQTMRRLLEAISPFPVSIAPARVREGMFGTEGEPEAEELYRSFMENEFSFEAIGEYLKSFNEVYENFGQPAFAYVALDSTSLETMTDIEAYMGGVSENHQALLYNEDTGVWQPLRFVASACGDGLRVSDIEYLAVMSGMLPVMPTPEGIWANEGYTPAYISGAVNSGAFDKDVRDVVVF